MSSSDNRQSETQRRRGPILALADAALLCGEVLARQIYWRMPRMRRRTARGSLQIVSRGELRDYLREIGADGELVLAHTGVTSLRLLDSSDASSKGGFMTTAKLLVDDLLEVVGTAGTLLMPTNPAYENDDLRLSLAERRDLVVRYDPARTPCAVGMANELFRRRPGVHRCLHPYNPLAARGPLAEELFRDNLNRREPLPHGVDSAYYRFCRRNGLVIGVGVPLWHAITIIHVPEEVRDAEWPIRDFFERRRYSVRIGDGDEVFTVRQRRLEFGTLCACNRKVRRDLLREGVLHEGRIGSATVDWARGEEVYDYFMRRNRRSHYPYYGIGLVNWNAF
jgi:aminoglycoside 3-N-acetyltransferase